MATPKLNKHFGKKDENGIFSFAPAVLTVVTHHHSEGVDEETGEPWSNDYDTFETKLHPTPADYAQMGYLPVIDKAPAAPVPEGFHYVATDDYEETNGVYYRVYTTAANPQPTLDDFDRAMENYLKREREDRGYTTREPDSYLDSSVPRWKQDAEDWVAHRDAVMLYGLELMNEVKSGQREPPTMAEFLAGLPKIVWTVSMEEE